MGESCATCGISNLPIKGGTKVVGAVVVTHPDWSAGKGGSYSEPTGWSQPASFLFHGTLDDYARVRKVKKTRTTQAILELFRRPEEEEIETFLNEVVRDSKYRVPGDQRTRDSPVGLFLMREDVYETALATMDAESETFWDAEEDKLVSAHRDHIDKLKDLDSRGEKAVASIRFNLDNYGRVLNSFRLVGVHEAFMDATASEDLDALSFYVRSLYDLLKVNSIMSDLRRSWHPKSGAGGQVAAWESHKALAEAVLRICEKALKTRTTIKS